jgi:hypothetical protein
MTAPTEIRPQSAPPAPASRRGGWFAPVFGLVIAIATVAAIGLAAIAPLLGEGAPSDLPSGWTTVFDTDLTATTTGWETGVGCSSGPEGLFVSEGRTRCAYTPSQQTDYLSQGFRLDVTLAPAASVEQSQVPVLEVGTATFGIGQDGSFILTTPGNLSGVTGSAFNWHANGLTANTIRLEWDGPQTPLVAYTNGYKAVETLFSMSAASTHTLKLGSGRDAQALYTHVTLASAE